jgi:hypothetical protein
VDGAVKMTGPMRQAVPNGALLIGGAIPRTASGIIAHWSQLVAELPRGHYAVSPSHGMERCTQCALAMTTTGLGV